MAPRNGGAGGGAETVEVASRTKTLPGYKGRSEGVRQGGAEMALRPGPGQWSLSPDDERPGRKPDEWLRGRLRLRPLRCRPVHHFYCRPPARYLSLALSLPHVCDSFYEREPEIFQGFAVSFSPAVPPRVAHPAERKFEKPLHYRHPSIILDFGWRTKYYTKIECDVA